MLEKLKQYKNHPFVQQFRDIRSVGLATFVVIVLLISWSGVKVIQTNYELQKHIATLQQKVSVGQLENKNLQLKNEYYATNQYLELSARQNFGLGQPGEKELIVPKSVALANAAQLPQPNSGESSQKKPWYQRNFEAWISFFLHHQSPQD